MIEDDVRQAVVDQEHLKLLGIGYLISAGLDAFFSLFGLLYACFGLFIFSALAHDSTNRAQQPPPEFIAWMFGLIGLGIFLMMVTFFVLRLLVYRRLVQRRGRVFCIVVAALGCIFIPYGTLLGVFTFMVLGRPSIVRLFVESRAAVAAKNVVGSDC